MKYESLENFIREVLNSDENCLYINVFSLSKHKKLIEETLNQIVKEYPEFYFIANCFGLYPIQLWSQNKREDLKIDLSTLEYIKETKGVYAGIVVHDQMELQSRSLKLTERIICDFNHIFNNINEKNYKLIINDYLNETNCTRYVMKTYLKTLLIKIFSKNFEAFEKYRLEIEDMRNEVDDEIYLAYHDAEYLINVVRELKFNNIKNGNIDSFKANETIYRLINSLRCNPYAKDCYRFVKLYYESCKEKEIATITKRSCSYVKRQHEIGIKAMEIILWGYSS